MNTWLEISRLSPFLLVGLLAGLALTLFLYDGLRHVVHQVRSWLAARAGSPEAELVDAVAHHQGSFHLATPSATRQRFAQRYDLTVRTHWMCEGQWKPYR